MRQIVKIGELVNKELRISAHFIMSDEKIYLIKFTCTDETCKFIYASCLDRGQFGLDPEFTENEIKLLEQFITNYLRISKNRAAI
jgi:hypothetical protein